jgi:16S rRNA (cytosine1402-N4)-methyltransferase
VPTAASDPISYHIPVLSAAVRAWADGSARAVDATLGGGGHAAILRGLGARVLGIDRDPDALAAARHRLGTEGIEYLEGSFAAPAALAAIQSFNPDRILLDLGVSSHQIDTAERGFTFRPGARLDMRMQASGLGSRDKGIAAGRAELLARGGSRRILRLRRRARARARSRVVIRRRLREGLRHQR